MALSTPPPPLLPPLTVQFLGSGDAFGTGGRLQTCILVDSAGGRFLIDCGASSPIALHRWRIDPNTISLILLTHLHGDHFGGVPFLLLQSQFVTGRTQPLTIAGPPGTTARLAAAQEVLYPGSTSKISRFKAMIVELPAGEPRILAPVTVTPFPAAHEAGDPCYTLRVETAGRTITYTGDTGWTEALLPAAAETDLFIAECYFYDEPSDTHMNWRTWQANRHRFTARRTVYTHLGPAMLEQAPRLAGNTGAEFATDGLLLDL